MYRDHVKRALDLLMAMLLAVPAGLVVLLCAAAVKAESDGPAFFVQQRPGYRAKPFSLYKLRSMLVQREKDGVLLSDMGRLTKTGRLMRKLSLDELPQLYNILRGDMSFIGPRPLLTRYLPLYTPEQMRRHEARPGISGWAQVNGRNELKWEEKFKLDVWYVDHISLRLDLKIFWMTLVNVVKHKGINAGEGETMPPFTGSPEETADA
jgi:lipopolysaccharide/colanic/teichoic acid biosynthesis glycosyltransferase